MLDPDGGTASMPRGSRIGYIAQEAPGGTASPFETVLAADSERAALMIESETCTDHQRLAEVHDRLIAIDAYTADARAARILIGLGFDEAMQAMPLKARPMAMGTPISMSTRNEISRKAAIMIRGAPSAGRRRTHAPRSPGTGAE